MNHDRKDPHAVRWARAKRDGETTFTRWHWTRDSYWTACGRMIAIGREVAFLPETDEDRARVDCRLCRARATFREAQP